MHDRRQTHVQVMIRGGVDFGPPSGPAVREELGHLADEICLLRREEASFVDPELAVNGRQLEVVL